jgi:hypothetical protein
LRLAANRAASDYNVKSGVGVAVQADL